MLSVTAKEAKNRLGEYMKEAMREPVEITHHGKPSIYLVSRRDFVPRLSSGFKQDALDEVKLRLSCEVLSKWTLPDIRRRSCENIQRWSGNGVTSPAYGEWLELMQSGSDQQVLVAMIGLSQESNRLRQSLPYVGLLSQEEMEQIREQITA